MKFFVLVGIVCNVLAFAQDSAVVLHPEEYDLKVEWGVSGRKGKRLTVEDAFAVQSSRGQMLFSVYDGHAGGAAAHFAACRLPEEIFKSGEEKAFPFVDNLIENSESISGTTAITARITPQTDGTYDLCFAWVGDARGVLVSTTGCPRVETIDHKPENPFESKRIKDAGGTIYPQICPETAKKILRVARPESEQDAAKGKRAGLSLTRALGDKQWSNELISPDPELLTYKLQPGLDGFLILGCDGLWDAISTPHAAAALPGTYAMFQTMNPLFLTRLCDDSDACIADDENTQEAGNVAYATLTARTLRDTAYAYGSTDNITAMVVRFVWEKKMKANANSADDQSGGLLCCLI